MEKWGLPQDMDCNRAFLGVILFWMSNTTKLQLAVHASQTQGCTQAQAQKVLETFLGLVGEHLETGNTVELRGFGRFSAPYREPRPARNPHTGEEVFLPRRRTAAFRFSSEILEQLQGKTVEHQFEAA
jgi:nucleoid DNA-binding protein